MATPPLLLVDGMAGSGKSTTAQWLSLELAKVRPTVWYHEDRAGIELAGVYKSDRNQSVADFADAVAARWGSFVSRIQSDGRLWIVESCVLQMPIIGLLLHNVRDEAIMDVVRAIDRAVSPVAPWLIYLRPRDASAALQRATRSRYAGLLGEYIARNEQSVYGRERGHSGYDGLVEFWDHFLRLSDRLVAEFEARKVTVDTSGPDWASHYGAIRAFLQQSGMQLPAEGASWAGLSPAELSRYEGVYSRTRDNGTAEFEIRLVDGVLTVFGLAPYLWDAGNRLLPKGRGVFAAASWPTELRFEETEDGVTAFRLVTALGGRNTDERFPRIADL